MTNRINEFNKLYIYTYIEIFNYQKSVKTRFSIQNNLTEFPTRTNNNFGRRGISPIS